MAPYLGLDIGATHARWVVLDAVGDVVSRGASPADRLGGGEPAGWDSLWEEIVEAVGPPAAAVAGVAGVSDPALRRQLARVRDAVRFPLWFTGDPEAAAAAALQDAEGVALWAGTGSFAVARASDGALHRVGGRGAFVSDDGGAFMLVCHALRAAVAAADGLGEPTRLAMVLGEHFAVEPVHLGRVLRACSKAEVAAASTHVASLAEDGDEGAARVMHQGASALVGLVCGAASRAGLVAPLRLVLGGGVLRGSPAYARQVEVGARECGFAEVGASARDAAEGAALLARARHLGLAPLASWVVDASA